MSERAFRIALLGIVLVTLVGAPLDVMEVDAAQYAGMSRDMLTSTDPLQLFFRGHDYLDKPPLLFWLSATSFKVFGVHNWSYKLPSILFAFLALFATYRFALLHHGREVARTATLMLGSSAAFLLMTNDVRCDTLLTGSVITAIWLGAAYLQQRRWWQLIGCAVAIAAGMLAKGPMGTMAPLLALGGHVVLARKWSVLKDARLLLVVPIIGALLLPMCIGLYQQHGAHGVRFFFWEQSFGRLTGENRWKDDSTYLFFTHEVLWQLLPWTVFVLTGLWRSLADGVRRRVLPEYITLSGTVLVFVALSLSHFKLPHYLYVIVPLFAVLGAQGWHAVHTRWPGVVHACIMLLLAAAALVLVGWSFAADGTWAVLLVAAALVACAWWLRRNLQAHLFLASFFLMCAIGVAVNGHVYPQLLAYQANAQAGKWAARHGLDADHFHGMQVSGTALDFYAGFPVQWLSNVDEVRSALREGGVIYTDATHRQQLLDAGFVPQQQIELADYRVQLLGIELLIPSQRAAVLEPRYLLVY